MSNNDVFLPFFTQAPSKTTEKKLLFGRFRRKSNYPTNDHCCPLFIRKAWVKSQLEGLIWRQGLRGQGEGKFLTSRSNTDWYIRVFTKRVIHHIKYNTK